MTIFFPLFEKAMELGVSKPGLDFGIERAPHPPHPASVSVKSRLWLLQASQSRNYALPHSASAPASTLSGPAEIGKLILALPVINFHF